MFEMDFGKMQFQEGNEGLQASFSTPPSGKASSRPPSSKGRSSPRLVPSYQGHTSPSLVTSSPPDSLLLTLQLGSTDSATPAMRSRPRSAEHPRSAHSFEPTKGLGFPSLSFDPAGSSSRSLEALSPWRQSRMAAQQLAGGGGGGEDTQKRKRESSTEIEGGKGGDRPGSTGGRRAIAPKTVQQQQSSPGLSPLPSPAISAAAGPGLGRGNLEIEGDDQALFEHLVLDHKD